jgi:signal peptidase I
MYRARERIVNGHPQLEGRNVKALTCDLAGEILRSSGSLRLRVTGWSMLPTVWPGDTLVVEPVSTDSVSEGDIVMFSRGQRLVAHRVTKICGAGEVQTQGDAVPRPDAPVAQREVLGKVSAIMRNGKRIEPSRHLRSSARAIAAVLRRSEITARVVVGVHGLRQTSQA